MSVNSTQEIIVKTVTVHYWRANV